MSESTSSCPFCTRVRNKEYDGIRQDVVWFEPLNPVTQGHMLFIPTKHITSAASSSSNFAKVARAAGMYVNEKGVEANIITSVGPLATQSVFHLHVHVVPRREHDGLHLPWTGQKK